MTNPSTRWPIDSSMPAEPQAAPAAEIPAPQPRRTNHRPAGWRGVVAIAVLLLASVLVPTVASPASAATYGQVTRNFTALANTRYELHYKVYDISAGEAAIFVNNRKVANTVTTKDKAWSTTRKISLNVKPGPNTVQIRHLKSGLWKATVNVVKVGATTPTPPKDPQPKPGPGKLVQTIGVQEGNCLKLKPRCWDEFSSSGPLRMVWQNGDKPSQVFRWIGEDARGKRHEQQFNLRLTPNEKIRIQIRPAYATANATFKAFPQAGKGSVDMASRTHTFTKGYRTGQVPTDRWNIEAKANGQGQLQLNVALVGSRDGTYFYTDSVHLGEQLFTTQPVPNDNPIVEVHSQWSKDATFFTVGPVVSVTQRDIAWTEGRNHAPGVTGHRICTKMVDAPTGGDSSAQRCAKYQHSYYARFSVTTYQDKTEVWECVKAPWRQRKGPGIDVSICPAQADTLLGTRSNTLVNPGAVVEAAKLGQCKTNCGRIYDITYRDGTTKRSTSVPNSAQSNQAVRVVDDMPPTLAGDLANLGLTEEKIDEIIENSPRTAGLGIDWGKVFANPKVTEGIVTHLGPVAAKLADKVVEATGEVLGALADLAVAVIEAAIDLVEAVVDAVVDAITPDDSPDQRPDPGGGGGSGDGCSDCGDEGLGDGGQYVGDEDACCDD